MELELYIHIPFCVKKCDYCDFLSGSQSESVRGNYVEMLKKEIVSYQEMAKPYEVGSIFLGGGTPSILSGQQIEGILGAAREIFRIREDAEITMEMNPGTIREEHLLLYKKAGINRISIGLQSARNEDLKKLGRIHTWEVFLENYQLARKLGFENINIDLMSAIPDQTAEDWEEVLCRAAGLGAEHLSAYSLIIEENTPFYERYGGDEGRRHLPDEETERRMYERTEEILSRYGYHRYEISNYAKPGYECRHNLGYWERKNYLGIGLGAASLLENVRFSHIDSLETYLHEMETHEEQASPEGILLCITEEPERLSLSEQAEEFLFLGLRKMEGISKTEFLRQFHKPIETVYGKTLERFAAGGFLEIDGDRMRLTKEGIDVSNQIFVGLMEPEL